MSFPTNEKMSIKNLNKNLEEIDFSNMLSFYAPNRFGHCGTSDEISLQRLWSAYMQGIFPWFCEERGERVTWHSPDPRFCILMNEFHVPKRVERFLKKSPFRYTMDSDFAAVIRGCRKMNRDGQSGTWIGDKMESAYIRFFEAGFAHSVEAWHGNTLAGGFYGVLIGSVFFGESMFTIEPESSKSAFVLFAKAFGECGGKIIDSQVYTDNIARFGAKNIMRDEFLFLEKPCLSLPLFNNLSDVFARSVSDFPKI